jgi:hypothetical protein
MLCSSLIVITSFPVRGRESESRQYIARRISQSTVDLISCQDWTYSGWRPRQNQVTFLKFQPRSIDTIFLVLNRTYLKSHDRRNVFNEARDTEKHVGRVTILLDYPIDLPELASS